MSTADIVILCAILLPTVVGVIYGFLNIIFSLLCWVISLGLAVKLVPYLSPLLENHIDPPMLRIILAFIVLFILCLLILNFFKSATVSPGHCLLLSSSNTIIAPFDILGRKYFSAINVGL